MSEARKLKPRPDRYDVWVKRIYIAANKRGLSREQVHEIVHEMTGGEVDSTKRLWPHERRRLLRSLQGAGPYAASKEQVWSIEHIYLLRLGWSWGQFEAWMTGEQSPCKPQSRGQAILTAWPALSVTDANRIIEGLKGLWMSILGIDDVRAEHRRMIAISRLCRRQPNLLQTAFHKLKSKAF